jgi:DNA-3-methyladenine glycosylase
MVREVEADPTSDIESIIAVNSETKDFLVLFGNSVEVAQKLLGCQLIRETEHGLMIGRIVETEAYDQIDAASHSFRGKTPRVEVMFGPAGKAYVYFTYGMHYCFNVVTGPAGHGSAVLVRALEPLDGLDLMRINRHRDTIDRHLTDGPAKLCQALRIDRSFNGHDLRYAPLKLLIQSPISTDSIIQTTRIGITKDASRPWRFYIKNNPFVSGSLKGRLIPNQ